MQKTFKCRPTKAQGCPQGCQAFRKCSFSKPNSIPAKVGHSVRDAAGMKFTQVKRETSIPAKVVPSANILLLRGTHRRDAPGPAAPPEQVGAPAFWNRLRENTYKSKDHGGQMHAVLLCSGVKNAGPKTRPFSGQRNWRTEV